MDVYFQSGTQRNKRYVEGTITDVTDVSSVSPGYKYHIIAQYRKDGRLEPIQRLILSKISDSVAQKLGVSSLIDLKGRNLELIINDVRFVGVRYPEAAPAGLTPQSSPAPSAAPGVQISAQTLSQQSEPTASEQAAPAYTQSNPANTANNAQAIPASAPASTPAAARNGNYSRQGNLDRIAFDARAGYLAYEMELPGKIPVILPNSTLDFFNTNYNDHKGRPLVEHTPQQLQYWINQGRVSADDNSRHDSPLNATIFFPKNAPYISAKVRGGKITDISANFNYVPRYVDMSDVEHPKEITKL